MIFFLGEYRTSSAEPPNDDHSIHDRESGSGSSDRHWVSEPSLVEKYKQLSSSTSFLKNEFQKSSRGCAKRILQKKSNFDQPLIVEIPSYDIKKAQIDWEAFDRLKYSYKEHLCTLNNELSFSRSNSSGGSTDSLIEEANDFLQVSKQKLVTTQDWSNIQDKKLAKKRRKNKSYDLEY